jgi:hypothetical protein
MPSKKVKITRGPNFSSPSEFSAELAEKVCQELATLLILVDASTVSQLHAFWIEYSAQRGKRAPCRVAYHRLKERGDLGGCKGMGPRESLQ